MKECNCKHYIYWRNNIMTMMVCVTLILVKICMDVQEIQDRREA